MADSGAGVAKLEPRMIAECCRASRIDPSCRSALCPRVFLRPFCQHRRTFDSATVRTYRLKRTANPRSNFATHKSRRHLLLRLLLSRRVLNVQDRVWVLRPLTALVRPRPSPTVLDRLRPSLGNGAGRGEVTLQSTNPTYSAPDRASRVRIPEVGCLRCNARPCRSSSSSSPASRSLAQT